MRKLVKVAVVAIGILFSAGMAQAQQKFAHIDAAEILKAMPEMKTADANLQTFTKQKQASLEQMDGERQRKVQAYQDKAKTLSEANKAQVGKELETMGKDIQDLEKRLMEAQQKAQQELGTKQGELYQPIYQKVENAIKAVAKEKGYAYVFDVSQSGVVYFDGGDNLNTAVKAKLGIK